MIEIHTLDVKFQFVPAVRSREPIDSVDSTADATVKYERIDAMNNYMWEKQGTSHKYGDYANVDTRTHHVRETTRYRCNK